MKYIIALSMSVLTGTIFSADTENQPQKNDKVEYYTLKHNHINIFNLLPNYLVPKASFDEQMQYEYMLPHQRKVWVYGPKKDGVVTLLFAIIPGVDYSPKNHKHEYTVQYIMRTPHGMQTDANVYHTKHAVLKFIEEQTVQKREAMINNPQTPGIFRKIASE